MHNTFNDETVFINALKKGESNAYKFLVDKYHHQLCVYAFGLTNDRDLAEDIVQNVFIKIWKHRFKLKESFSVKGYLYRSVYNEFIDQYRKHKTVISLEKKYIDALSVVVEEETDNSLSKLIDLVKQEIEKLPPKCKQIFLLSKKEGLTNLEISEYLGVSLKSVEAHITKAFSTLRKSTGVKNNGFFFLLFNVSVSNVNGLERY